MMSTPPQSLCLGPGPDPIELIRRWPEHQPLAALVSARGGAQLSRWSILAAPVSTQSCQGDEANLVESLNSLGAEQTLDPVDDPEIPPFRGGRLLMLRYELGRALEPRAGMGSAPMTGVPVAQALECPSALAHDRVTGHWWLVGDIDDAQELKEILDLDSVEAHESQIDPLKHLISDEQYARLVSQTVSYIEAGDLFQANITRRFSAQAQLESRRSRRQLAAGLLIESGAWFGGLLELPGLHGEETIISLSPELFLQLDPVSRRIRTRPIKGTLPAGADPEDLKQSEKDAAELAMIVDLMRNDLGRVSDPGSVRVESPRSIEQHPGVIHGVGEVSGILKDGIQMGTLLAATFPPGSITGAPKIRAMQIIDEFENTPRGAYCGAIGYSSRCGRMALDVSIRTVELVPSNLDKKGPYSHELRYGAGCGIVAQSCPESEVDESWTKTALLARFITEQCRSVEADSSKNQLDDSSDSSERACASS